MKFDSKFYFLYLEIIFWIVDGLFATSPVTSKDGQNVSYGSFLQQQIVPSINITEKAVMNVTLNKIISDR